MKLRDYQQRSIDQLYDWFRKNEKGDPCLVLPTGAGKSHIVAALCKDAVQNWPETRVLMLTHVRELIEQNAEKMREHWPAAPMGIYSASVGRRDLGEPITFAGIQSVRTKAELLGHIDICIVDECHLISHKQQGGYRTLIADLQRINPAMRVVGLTATPFRLGHGYITDGEAIFDDLIEPVTVEELIYKGYLSILKSKITKSKLSTEGVHKRGGEYIEKELQAAVDTKQNNQSVVDEVISLAGNRKSWLFFCAGVEHAEHVCQELIDRGIKAACVTGSTPKGERQRIIDAFKAGDIKALTNANVLTTGFDAPGIDLIAMLRPTMSTALYIQMAGRGLRISPGKTDCLVLDFAGVVETHGPITAVRPPKQKQGDGGGEMPTKVCEHCNELVFIAAKACPSCGEPFPEPEKKEMRLHDVDIMGLEGSEMEVTGWKWRKHTSSNSGKDMLAVTYYGALSDEPVKEYFCIAHPGYAGQKAMMEFSRIAHQVDCKLANLNIADPSEGLRALAEAMTQRQPPTMIEYRKDGKFHRVLKRSWSYEA